MTSSLPARRRDAVMQAWPQWNGLDDVDVSGDQRTLTLWFLGKAPGGLRPAHVVIEPPDGGPAVRALGLRACREDDQALDDCVQVRVDRPGGWGTYRLCLVELDERGRPTPRPFPGFDPRLTCLEFSFKMHYPSDVDCAPTPECPPEPPDRADLNYLARDYGSLRQLLLDRLAGVIPQWSERHVPDAYLTLIELLAFTGDRFSAAQDAVATEAYLGTARLRRSVRRHARLVDYRMHDGCNARTFVQVQVTGGEELVTLRPARGELQVTSADGRVVFEPLLPGAVRWWAAQNRIELYTWGDGPCVLPRGSTQASLNAGPLEAALPRGGNPLHLRVGDFLLLEETLGPQTGVPGDARPDHRQVVRLTDVNLKDDHLYGVRVLDVRWSEEDALTFDLCLCGRGQPPECLPITPGGARGNLLLVDHGRTVHESLPPVPSQPTALSCDDCDCGPPAPRPGPYEPALTATPLTSRQAAHAGAPAAALLRQDPRQALPDLTLTDGAGAAWLPVADLLESGPEARVFVTELEEGGAATLRFGRGRLGQAGLGRALEAGQSFTAAVRVGTGRAGNSGPGMLTRLVLGGGLSLPAGVSVTVNQPVPATGGQEPEALDEVRRQAPVAFRSDLKRAVTAEDYATLASTLFPGRVQRAAATRGWNGVNEQITLAVDALGTPDAPENLVRAVRDALEPYRRLGHTLSVHPARTVGLNLTLDVCVDTHASRTAVRADLLTRLGTGQLPDSSPAAFHPDALSFGQPVILSRLVAAAAGVPGVRSVTVSSLRRQDRPHDPALQQGELSLGPTEIARLDNDPHRPAHGTLTLNLVGGR